MEDLVIRSRSDLDEPVFEIVHQSGSVVAVCASQEEAERQLDQFRLRVVARTSLPTRGGNLDERASHALRTAESASIADALDDKLGITRVLCPKCGMVTSKFGEVNTAVVRCKSCNTIVEAPVSPEQGAGASTKTGLLIKVAALIAVLIMGGVVWWLRTELTGGESDTGIRLVREQKGRNSSIDSVTEEQLLDIVDHARHVADAYSAAKTLKEKLRFVRRPERVLAKMQKLASRQSMPAEIERVGIGTATLVRHELSGRAYLLTQAELRDSTPATIVFELLENGDLLIDWESLVGYCEMTWSEFRRSKPAKPQVFRITLERSEYYAYDFDDRENDLAFRIADLSGENVIYGYVPRIGEVSSTLFSLFKQARKPRVSAALTLAYPENARTDDQVRIVKVLSPNWVLGYGFRSHKVLATTPLKQE